MPPRGSEEGASLARELAAALAAVKRELAAILLVGLAGIPLASLWLEGLREVLVLAGYGLGGAIWVRVRVRGVLLHARRGQRGQAADPGTGRDGAA